MKKEEKHNHCTSSHYVTLFCCYFFVICFVFKSCTCGKIKYGTYESINDVSTRRLKTVNPNHLSQEQLDGLKHEEIKCKANHNKYLLFDLKYLELTSHQLFRRKRRNHFRSFRAEKFSRKKCFHFNH